MQEKSPGKEAEAAGVSRGDSEATTSRKPGSPNGRADGAVDFIERLPNINATAETHTCVYIAPQSTEGEHLPIHINALEECVTLTRAHAHSRERAAGPEAQ